VRLDKVYAENKQVRFLGQAMIYTLAGVEL